MHYIRNKVKYSVDSIITLYSHIGRINLSFHIARKNSKTDKKELWLRLNLLFTLATIPFINTLFYILLTISSEVIYEMPRQTNRFA